MKINEFGEKLKYLRNEKGFTCASVVEELGMRGITIYEVRNWERGLAHPSTEVIRKLAQIYNVPAEELIFLHEQTIQTGFESVHMNLIQVVSKWMGVSMYTTIVLARIMLVILCIIGVLLFVQSMGKFVEFGQRGI